MTSTPRFAGRSLRLQPSRRGVPAASLFASRSPMFDSVEIVPPSLTHFVEYDRVQARGDSIALCTEWVAKWNISSEPTCPQCRAALAVTADEMFGAEEV